jgi:hypothetical protein
MLRLVLLFALTTSSTIRSATGFVFQHSRTTTATRESLSLAAKGFGSASASPSASSSSNSNSKGSKKGKKGRLYTIDEEEQKSSSSSSNNKPYVKSEQDALLEQLASQASRTCIGQAVALSSDQVDPFWELIPSLIHSRFPNVPDKQFERIAGFVRHTLNPDLPLEDEIVLNPHRPESEIHAFMPGLGETKPFHDPNELALCRLLSENYETIHNEYKALLKDHEDRFQSVTDLNYKGGWKCLPLFFNSEYSIHSLWLVACARVSRMIHSFVLCVENCNVD